MNEGKDIFGFEKSDSPSKAPDEEYDGPIIPLKAEFLIEDMLGNAINGIEPFSAYADQIQWGSNPGAVRMVISPLGSFKSIIRKMHHDLVGEEVWVCKSVVPYKDIMHSNFKFDESLSEQIFENIQSTYADPINPPKSDYEGLQRLCVKTYNKLLKRGILPELMIPIGIKTIKENQRYIMHFELRGHGVEAPGSARVEAFMVEMSYDPKTGMIRSFGHDVQSPTRGHTWIPQPSEWDEYFSPTQPESEIIDSIANAFKTY